MLVRNLSRLHDSRYNWKLHFVHWSGRFYGSTRNALKYVVRQANISIENLRNVSDYLDSAKWICVDSNALAPGVQNDIDAIQTKINTSASFFSEEARKNSKRILHVLNAM